MIIELIVVIAILKFAGVVFDRDTPAWFSCGFVGLFLMMILVGLFYRG